MASKRKAKTVDFQCDGCGKLHRISPMSLFGQIKSAKKSRSSKQNGKLGGRPVNPHSKRQQLLAARQPTPRTA